MAIIKITPEEVHDVARQFEQASQQSQEMVSKLQTTLNNLQPNWDGMTAERFYGDYEQWRTSMTQYVELLQTVGTELHSIAQRFASVDGQA